MTGIQDDLALLRWSCDPDAVEVMQAHKRVEAEIARLESDKALLRDEGDVLLRNVRSAQKRVEAAEAEVARLEERDRGTVDLLNEERLALIDAEAEVARLKDGLQAIANLATEDALLALDMAGDLVAEDSAERLPGENGWDNPPHQDSTTVRP